MLALLLVVTFTFVLPAIWVLTRHGTLLVEVGRLKRQIMDMNSFYQTEHGQDLVWTMLQREESERARHPPGPQRWLVPSEVSPGQWHWVTR